MKKQLIPALFLAASLFACEEIDPATDHSLPVARIPVINAIDPEAAACGTEITLYGDNFGTNIFDHFVTFDTPGSEVQSGRIAEVLQVFRSGVVMVRVPVDLAPGDYTVRMQVRSEVNVAEKAFRIRE